MEQTDRMVHGRVPHNAPQLYARMRVRRLDSAGPGLVTAVGLAFSRRTAVLAEHLKATTHLPLQPFLPSLTVADRNGRHLQAPQADSHIEHRHHPSPHPHRAHGTRREYCC